MASLQRSLTDLPIKILRDIIDLVFSSETIAVHMDVRATYQDDPQKPDSRSNEIWRGHSKSPCRVYISHASTQPSHPLMFVSRSIRAEALPRFGIDLHIDRSSFTQSFVKDASDTWQTATKGGSIAEFGAGVLSDDLRGVMSEWLRHSVRTIYVKSGLFVDGKCFHHDQFPRLERLFLRGVVDTLSERDSGRTREQRVRDSVFLYCTAERLMSDFLDESSDGEITQVVKKKCSAGFVDMNSLQDRGFEILVEVTVVVRGRSNQFTHGVFMKGHLDVVVDYDRLKVLSRRNPIISILERNRAGALYDWKVWKLEGRQR